MHTWSEPLLVGDAPAQIAQLDSFFPAERSAQTLFMLCSNPRELAKNFTPMLCELKRVVATILRAPNARDNPFCLEIIHQSHHPAGHDAKVFGQCLLAHSRI